MNKTYPRTTDSSSISFFLLHKEARAMRDRIKSLGLKKSQYIQILIRKEALTAQEAEHGEQG